MSIEQQLDRLRVHLQAQGLTLTDRNVFRDDGYSGARLNRPGLDRLRDALRERRIDRVVLTAPDRLARQYVHQMRWSAHPCWKFWRGMPCARPGQFALGERR